MCVEFVYANVYNMYEICVYAYVDVSLPPVHVVGGWGSGGVWGWAHTIYGGREHETWGHAYTHTDITYIYIEYVYVCVCACI